MIRAGIIIVGAGASGLMAALHAARAGAKVILLEKEALPGRKILVTGNGRCNFSNLNAAPAAYYGAADFVAPALAGFTPQNCVDFFASIGLLARDEGQGRLFPTTGKASSVADCLVNAAVAEGVDIRIKTLVASAHKEENNFKVTAQSGEVFEAPKLILACGSQAWPQAGGSDFGYKLAQSFGHTITPLSPAISPINIKEAAAARLAGLRVWAGVTLQGQEGQDSEEGEIIFSSSGVSGNNILSLSRSARPGDKLLIDFLPQIKDYPAFTAARRAQMPAGATVKNFLAGMLADSAANLLLDYLGIKKTAPLSELSAANFARMVGTIKAWPFTVSGLRGSKEAAATRGGVSRAEVEAKTLQSKLAKNLFITGELLDVDGRCGGYSLHFAWASAVLAAVSASKEA